MKSEISNLRSPVPVPDWIARLPKAEIHLHLEGAATPEFLVELARRRGESLPLEEARAKFNYSGFMGFLMAYKWACDQLRAPEDYAALARDLAARLRAQNALYAELTLSAGVVLWKHQDLDAVCEALVRAAEDSRREQGLEVRWILDAVRNFGADHVARVAEYALRWKDAGVVAFGVGGYEAQEPAELFRETFDKIRAAGLRVTIHAGETEGPESIWSAIRDLGAERIGHGLAAFRDSDLMEYLKEKQITLEVCPSSNVRTGALRQHTGSDDLATHPLVPFVRRGLRVTLNTDDPGFFDTDLNREYTLAHQIGLSREDLLRVAEAAFESAFCEEVLKQTLRARFHPG
ncbi:MAG TPA: adenosine deaminase [Candidatus Xenobia bacterium]|nr:adenosine deaminase [Candidatus Xenobia bacterium]